MPDYEAIVREFCHVSGPGDSEAIDANRLASFFAEDGEWHVSVPGTVIKGRDAIRQAAEKMNKIASFIECGIRTIAIRGNTAMVERLDHFTMAGKRVHHALVAIYEFDDKGKITCWREYFDTADLSRQVGQPTESALKE